MARPEVIGSAHWQVIGTVDDAMEQIADWAAAGAMDGFIALPGGSVDSMRLTLDDLVPRLPQAGSAASTRVEVGRPPARGRLTPSVEALRRALANGGAAVGRKSPGVDKVAVVGGWTADTFCRPVLSPRAAAWPA